MKKKLISHINEIRELYVNTELKRIDFEQLFKELNYLEWGVKCLSALLLIYVNNNDVQKNSREFKRLLSKLDNSRSFGDWGNILNDLNNFYLQAEILFNSQKPKFYKVNKILVKNEFVTIRNKLIGHGIYDSTGRKYKLALQKIVQSKINIILEESMSQLLEYIDFEKGFAPFLDFTNGVGVPQEIILSAWPSKIVYADYIKDATWEKKYPFQDLSSIISEKSKVDDTSYILERVVKEKKLLVRQDFLAIKYIYNDIEKLLVDNTQIIKIYGERGSGKSILALMLDEHVKTDHDIIFLPMNDGLWRSQYYLINKIAKAMNENFTNINELKIFINEKKSENYPVIVLDGIDEVPRELLTLHADLMSFSLDTKTIKWITVSRSDEYIDNEVGDFLNKNHTKCASIKIDIESNQYQDLLLKWIELHVTFGKDIFLAKLEKTKKRVDFLTLKSWKLLADNDLLNIKEDSEPSSILQVLDKQKKDISIVSIIQVIYINKKPLSTWEISDLLFDVSNWNSWSLIREIIDTFPFIFYRVANKFNLSNIYWGEASLKFGADKKLIEDVVIRVYKRYFEHQNIDLYFPSNLKEYWITGGFFEFLIDTDNKLLTSVLFSKLDSEQSLSGFLGKYEELLRKLPLGQIENAYENYLTYLIKIGTKLSDSSLEYRFMIIDHFISLFNSPIRDIQWNSSSQVFEIYGREKQYFKYLIDRFEKFPGIFLTHENLSERKEASIRSTLLSTIISIDEEYKYFNEDMQLKEKFTEKLKSIILNKSGKFLVRIIEAYVRYGEDKNCVHELIFELFLNSYKSDPFLAQKALENLSKEFTLMQQTKIKDIELNINTISTKTDQLKNLQNYLTELFNVKKTNEIIHKLTSNDWREREKILQDSLDKNELANQIINVFERDVKVRGRLISEKDTLVKKILYKFLIYNYCKFKHNILDEIKKNMLKKLNRIKGIQNKVLIEYDNKSEKEVIENVLQTIDSKIQYAGALILIKCNDGYLFQLKTDGYPIKQYRGNIALIGGGIDGDDENPRATISRELFEEIVESEICKRIIDNIKFIGSYIVDIKDFEALGVKVFNYLYYSEVDIATEKISLKEGKAFRVEDLKEISKKIAWSHDLLVNECCDNSIDISFNENKLCHVSDMEDINFDSSKFKIFQKDYDTLGL